MTFAGLLPPMAHVILAIEDMTSTMVFASGQLLTALLCPTPDARSGTGLPMHVKCAQTIGTS